MKTTKRTINNPFGLTAKQGLVIEDVKAKVKRGEGLKLLDSTEKFYNVKNRASAQGVVNYNMKNKNFRDALVHSLVEKKILGADSKTEKRLLEGLDAEKGGQIDYDARLKYVQEVNKIAGVYAPEVKKNLNLNVEVTEKALDDKIKELQEQLK